MAERTPSTRERPRWSLLELIESLGLAVYGDVGGDEELAGITLGRADGSAGIVTDAREVQPGDVFVALLGSRSHGMEHAGQAFERGAVAVLAGTDLEIDDARWNELLQDAAEQGCVLVASDCDGRTALGRVARAWRRQAAWRVVGVTGSSGKTSTKDLLAALLDRNGFVAHASHANWNNEIGVPLTLLTAPASADVVICEMGMRGLGQIDYLCDIADPDIGIVTTAGTAHLELLGTTDAIVQAKAELLAGTWSGGVGIFPGVQPELVEAAGRVPDRLLPFGSGVEEAEDSAVLVTSVERTEAGLRGTIDLMGEERRFELPLHGIHQARNLAAAAAALVTLRGSASLLSEDALVLTEQDRVRFTGGRGQRIVLDDGGFVIDDAYNANPESMVAAIEELAAVRAPRRVAVLGRMAELGPGELELHAQVGMVAGQRREIDALVVIGDGVGVDALATGWERARDVEPARFESVEAALLASSDWRRPGDVVLVKASNSAGLGRLASGLVERSAGGTAP